MSDTEWDQIEQNIGMAITDIATLVVLMDQTYNDNEQYRAKLVADLKARYENGKKAHTETSTTWDEWSAEDFVLNISEELFDSIIYGAAFINKHSETVSIGEASDESR